MMTPYCPLPDTHSRVILKSLDEDDFLMTYINANYLKVSEDVWIHKSQLCSAMCSDFILFSADLTLCSLSSCPQSVEIDMRNKQCVCACTGLWGCGACIHRHSGSHREHSWGLLEDGVAGEEPDYSDDHQPGGEERGQ